MRLYTSPATPFGRKVLALILELGLEGRIEMVNVMGTPLAPGSLPVDQNPLGKIPALQTDAGAIYDSRVICRYLNDFAGGAMYPTGPAIWACLTREATVDGILEAALAMVYEVRLRPADKQFPDWIEAQWAKAARALDLIEAEWQPHLHGPLEMPQIGLACALEYLDFRLGVRNWREGRPMLAAWLAEFAKRPALLATQPVAV
ncbi:glutathione S-transferase [Cypionkella aquatica]|uniref:Glutathione S-transferase n=1 Tax=Cypionkella aquatica TaxID=1756042 RepID=A0AA37U5L8_9RHOB|nr:glutathione S-transferase [Cypionkella aquatica]GLS86126.1 glutathione S-transferase [Cypionkella aquatica]